MTTESIIGWFFYATLIGFMIGFSTAAIRRDRWWSKRMDVVWFEIESLSARLEAQAPMAEHAVPDEIIRRSV